MSADNNFVWEAVFHSGALWSRQSVLAAPDAAKAVDQVETYKDTTASVYSSYKHSASRTNRQRQLAAAQWWSYDEPEAAVCSFDLEYMYKQK